MLALQAVRVRLDVRHIVFGNAIGNSVVDGMGAGSTQYGRAPNHAERNDLVYGDYGDYRGPANHPEKNGLVFDDYGDNASPNRNPVQAVDPAPKDALSDGRSLTEAQVRALRAGAGPLTPEAAQEWVRLEDEPIGPAANGQQIRPSKAQIEASAALRARTAQAASDFWEGTGRFAPTTPDNQNLLSALKDTGKAVWNLGVDVLELGEMADPFAGIRRSTYRSMGIEIPKASDFRATYDTPSFGLTMEVLAPLVPASKLLGASRSLGGAAFIDGKFVHDLKPLSNLELYGTAVSRTPEEALQLLQRVGHDPDMLAQYRIVKLSESEYAARSTRLRFDFDATYGNVPDTVPSVSFKQNIASQMADGTSKIPIYVRKEVFDSDEAIVQILSHEMHETQALQRLAARQISTTDYKNLTRLRLRPTSGMEHERRGLFTAEAQRPQRDRSC